MIGKSIRYKNIEADSKIGDCVFLGYAEKIDKFSRGRFKCFCGNEFENRISRVSSGGSCGCKKIAHGKKSTAWLTQALTKHGYSLSKSVRSEYSTWNTMKARCLNPKNKSFHSYGGRGISLCDRWLKFNNFIIDMGDKPSTRHSIDRINNDGNYEPGNCRWATRKEQGRNMRSNRLITHDGQIKCLSEWGEYFGLSRKLTIKRLKSA